MSIVFKAALASAAAGLSLTSAATAQSYTAAQAERGAATFAASCAVCHAENLGGGPGTPPLTGPEFMFGWKGKNAGELFDYVKTMMPPGSAGTLSDQQYADTVAVILKANGHAPGADELTPEAAKLKAIPVGAP